MLTFSKWLLLEYSTGDLVYFNHLPNVVPPVGVAEAQARFGLTGKIKWKLLANKSFTHSRELNRGEIAMRVGDDLENWYHELGHSVYDRSDKKTIIPLLDKIREASGSRSDGYKWITIGDYKWTYSHSGARFERDEIFAITFAYVVGDGGKLDEPDLDSDYREMLKNVEARANERLSIKDRPSLDLASIKD